MAKSYRQWFSELVPTWLAGTVGQRLTGLWGLIADQLAEVSTEAVKARFLHSTTFPRGALRYIGAERSIPRYFGEADETYRRRLRNAWTTWLVAGTKQAIEEQLQLAGFAEASVRETTEWDWDGNAVDWSRFWVLFPNHPWSDWQIGSDVTIGGHQVIGLTATPRDMEFVRSIVRHWKPAHVRCQYLIFLHADMSAWDANPPDGTWDDPDNRNQDATFIPG